MNASLSASSSTVSSGSGSRSGRRRSVLAWIAVVCCIAFAGFLAMFSLDQPMFSIGFVMQSIPTMIILLGAALGWHRSWMGAAWLGFVAIAGAAWYHDAWQHWSWPLAINFPPLVLAIMFLIDALRRQ